MKTINKKLIMIFTITLAFIICVSIVKADTKSNNNNLKSLEIVNAELNPAFKSEITSYTVEVKYAVSGVKVRAEKEHAKARIISGTGYVPLRVGENQLQIKVKAEDETIKTYLVKIIRKQQETSDEDSNVEYDESGVPIYKINDGKIVKYEVDCADWDDFRQIWKLIRIIGPFLYIVFASFDFFKIVMAGGEEDIKKAKKLIPKRLIIFLLFILVPFIIQFMVDFISPSSNASNLDIFRCITGSKRYIRKTTNIQ